MNKVCSVVFLLNYNNIILMFQKDRKEIFIGALQFQRDISHHGEEDMAVGREGMVAEICCPYCN